MQPQSNAMLEDHIQFGGGEQSFQPFVYLGVPGRVIGFECR